MGGDMIISDKISIVSSIVTATIAIVAATIAFKTMHSWKEKEKFTQLVRIKRAIFSYRQKIENITLLNHDNEKIKDHILNVLQPALADVYHEMKLAGYNEKNSLEFKAFGKAWDAQQDYLTTQLDYNSLLNGAVELQEAIKVSYQDI